METIMTTAHKVAELIPHAQYAVTIEHRKAFEEALERLEKQLEKCPKLRETRNMTEHPAVFHYFCASTDIYVCEYDREEGLLFGYTVLGGDLHNSEWGYTSLEEILCIPVMNIDYYFEEQSIEAALHLKYPHYYKKPPSLQN